MASLAARTASVNRAWASRSWVSQARRASPSREATAWRARDSTSRTMVCCSSVRYLPHSAKLLSQEKIRPSAEAMYLRASRFFTSVSALARASRIMRWISSSDRPELGRMLMLCSRPVRRSRAETFTMPLESMSKATSIWGTPLGRGGRLMRSKRPRLLLCSASSRSPCRTWISTRAWLSVTVVKVRASRVGMVALRWMIFTKPPPWVSMPRLKGVTSSSTRSLISPLRTAPWMAAPVATTSSGLMLRFGSLPKKSRTSRWTRGMRVWPPTRMTSSTCFGVLSPCWSASLMGMRVNSTRSLTMASSCSRVRVASRCWGPLAAWAMKGRRISTRSRVESSHLAFSLASLSRWRAMRSVVRSMPVFSRNCWTSQPWMAWSISSPPRNVSPLVASTSKTPSFISISVKSKVPPPKS